MGSNDEHTHVDRPGAPASGQIRADFANETMAATAGHGLSIGDVIGKGGMAVVRRGEQLSLRREVAIKTVASSKERDSLLREAYVTAVLEHPNIVPIHELVFDEDGKPMLVLKRIEGESWLEQMPDRLSFGGEGPDAIEWNIRIVISVSRALSFASTRGIVHLDVKPANVMVGPFGEVYLLDWGLAGSFDAQEKFLPSVPDGTRAGTLGYMSPEQWDGTAAKIGPWTDVYLLAASLHHALTGVPPWRKISRRERVRQRGEHHMPEALWEILKRAMDPAPAERTQSAGAFRQELEDYLRQRGSIQMTDQGMRLARDAALARAASDTDVAEYTSVEAATTFRAALAQWPGNERAHRGSLRLAEARIDDALARNQPEVAARLLAALTKPPEELRQRVEAAVALAAQDASDVRAMHHDLDRAVGVKTRTLFLILGTPVWLGGWLMSAITANILWSLSLLVVGTLGWGVAVQKYRNELLSNRLNRTLVFDVFTLLTALIAVLVMGVVRGDSLASLSPFLIIVNAIAMAMVGITFDMRYASLCGMWLVFLGLTMIWPGPGPWFVLAGNMTMLAGVFWIHFQIRQAARSRS